jgi:hypothetical protein
MSEQKRADELVHPVVSGEPKPVSIPPVSDLALVIFLSLFMPFEAAEGESGTLFESIAGPVRLELARRWGMGVSTTIELHRKPSFAVYMAVEALLRKTIEDAPADRLKGEEQGPLAAMARARAELAPLCGALLAELEEYDVRYPLASAPVRND